MYEEMSIKSLDKEFEGNVLFRCKGGGVTISIYSIVNRVLKFKNSRFFLEKDQDTILDKNLRECVAIGYCCLHLHIHVY